MRLDLMTFNLRCDTSRDGEDRWDRRREFVAELIAEKGGDVVGVQEALPHQLVWLRKALPGYAALGVGRDDGRSAGEHAAIFYRPDRFRVAATGTFWFSPTPDVPGEPAWGARHRRICTWVRLAETASERAFWIYNLHLDHEAIQARERGVRLLMERVWQREPQDPAVAMGDFNAPEADPVIERLRQPGSPVPVDLFRRAHPEATEVATFHGFTGRGTERIDYLFGTPEWEVLEAEIVREHRNGRYPSDHFPVRATLRLPDAARTAGS